MVNEKTSLWLIEAGFKRGANHSITIFNCGIAQYFTITVYPNYVLCPRNYNNLEDRLPVVIAGGGIGFDKVFHLLEEEPIFVKYLSVSVGKEIFPQVILRDESTSLSVNRVEGADRHLPVYWNNQYFFLPGVSVEWNAHKL